MKYTIYDLYTGKILRTITCNPLMIRFQLKEGEAFLKGHPTLGQKVVDGYLVDIEKVFNIETYKENLNDKISVLYYIAIAAFLKIDNITCQIKNIGAIDELLFSMNLENSLSINFRDSLNEFHNVNLNTLITLKYELLKYQKFVREQKWLNESLLSLCETQADLESFTPVFQNYPLCVPTDSETGFPVKSIG